MLRDGDLAVEVTIYEPDIPPQSRVYLFFENKPLDPNQVKVTMELHRFGTRIDAFTYKKEDDYLVGSRIVEEPHSFDVKVFAEYQGKKSQWAYESYEGRVKITDQAAASVDLKFENAGPRKIRKLAEMTGRIVPDEDQMAKVSPRFPGVVLEANKKLGDKVTKGEVLAVIESSQSMTTYEITAPLSGIIIARDVTRGVAVTTDKPIYTIADLSNVWVDLNVQPSGPQLSESRQGNHHHREAFRRIRHGDHHLSFALRQPGDTDAAGHRHTCRIKMANGAPTYSSTPLWSSRNGKFPSPSATTRSRPSAIGTWSS